MSLTVLHGKAVYTCSPSVLPSTALGRKDSSRPLVASTPNRRGCRGRPPEGSPSASTRTATCGTRTRWARGIPPGWRRCPPGWLPCYDAITSTTKAKVAREREKNKRMRYIALRVSVDIRLVGRVVTRVAGEGKRNKHICHIRSQKRLERERAVRDRPKAGGERQRGKKTTQIRQRYGGERGETEIRIDRYRQMDRGRKERGKKQQHRCTYIRRQGFCATAGGVSFKAYDRVQNQPT